MPVASRSSRHCAPLAPASGKTVWLFDLDNTLHDASKAIFKAIDQGMTAAIAVHLELELEAAGQLRKTYWKRYGATVIGMVRHHGVDPKAFLNHSHGFDIAPLVHGETGLPARLRQLKGRKILLTNAPLDYARTVLRTLGILHQFESVWAIDHMHLQGRIKPKPSLALMKQVLARLGVSAHQVVLVEDTLKNLKSARQAGMKTVHVFHPGTPFSPLYSGRNSYVGVRVKSIGKLLTGRCPLRA
jgi:putative hydrolase of the HAD superfamily